MQAPYHLNRRQAVSASPSEPCFDSACDFCCSSCRWLIFAGIAGLLGGFAGGRDEADPSTFNRFSVMGFAIGVSFVVVMTLFVLCALAVLSCCERCCSGANPDSDRRLMIEQLVQGAAPLAESGYVAVAGSPLSVNTV